MAGFGQLLVLQDLDMLVDQLRYKLEHDPQYAAVTAAEQAVSELSATKVDRETERFAVSREQKRFEDEALAIEDKVKHLDASLYDGSVGGHKELEALQTEIRHLKEKQSELEDSAISQMEIGEPLDAGIAEISDQLAKAEADLESQRQKLTVLLANTDAELAENIAKREAATADIDDDVVAEYEKRRRLGGGVGAARLAAGGKCEGCHLTLARADYDSLKHAPEDQMVFCPECDRILVR